MNALKRQAHGLARFPSYLEHKAQIARIGSDPKYLSAHQRRRRPPRAEWLKARDEFRAALRAAPVRAWR